MQLEPLLVAPAHVGDGFVGFIARQTELGQHSVAEHEKPAKEAGTVREGAVKIQDRAREMEKETEVITRRADHYDSAELFLEVSIVLCSIALLAENKVYWKLSFVSTVFGIAIATYGLLLR